MPANRMKHRRVVHKSTAGILNSIPQAVDLVGNSPHHLTTNTVAHPYPLPSGRGVCGWCMCERASANKKIDILCQGENE